MNHSNIKLVVFDMAGTTIKDENNVHIALQTALAKENIEANLEEINEVMGIPKPVAIRILLEKKLQDLTKISDEFINVIHQKFIEEMIAFYQNSPYVSGKHDAEEVFQILRKNQIKVVLDTGFSRDITDTILNRLSWNENIDGSVASDEVANGRPFPDMIFKAMELAGITDINLVAKVGDTVSDIQEGKAAGCRLVIGVTSGAFSKEVLAKENPTHLINDLSELLQILEIA